MDVDEGAGESASPLPPVEEPKVSLVKRTPPRRPVPLPAPTPAAEEDDEGEEDEDDELAVDEPLLAARAHRPTDLIRFVAGLLGIASVFALAYYATSTTSGIGTDIHNNVKNVAPWLSTVTSLISTVAVLAVPLAFAVERLIKRDGLRVADGVLASVLAYGVSLAVDWWVADGASDAIRKALTQQPRAPGRSPNRCTATWRR